MKHIKLLINIISATFLRGNPYRYIVFSIVIFLFNLYFVSAQESVITFTNYTEKSIWVKSALPADGGVWFGANGELGGKYYFLNLSKNSYIEFVPATGPVINNLTYGHSGLWIGTNMGIEFLNYNNTPDNQSDDSIQTFTTADGLISSVIYGMSAENNGIWLGFDPGGLLYLYTGPNPMDKSVKRITVFQEFSDKWVYNITPAGTGSLWLSTWGKGACYLDYNNTPEITEDDRTICFDTANGLQSNVVRKIAIDSEGKKWLATAKGISIIKDNGNPFSGESITVENIGAGEGLTGTDVYDIVFDSMNRPWVATYGKGIFILDNGRWLNYTTDDGLVSDVILGLSAGEHDIFISSFWGGVSYAKY